MRPTGWTGGSAPRDGALASRHDDASAARPGRRSNGSVFTVRTLGQYFLHDVVHHLHDVGAPTS